MADCKEQRPPVPGATVAEGYRNDAADRSAAPESKQAAIADDWIFESLSPQEPLRCWREAIADRLAQHCEGRLRYDSRQWRVHNRWRYLVGDEWRRALDRIDVLVMSASRATLKGLGRTAPQRLVFSLGTRANTTEIKRLLARDARLRWPPVDDAGRTW